MKQHQWAVRLYLLNAAILFTHEIDSAYWHEWELFGIPGGIQVFNVLNFALLLVFLYGFGRVVEGARDGYVFSALLAGAGLFAVGAHSYFIFAGRPEFLLPVSLALLAATFVVSLAQGYLAIAVLRRGAAYSTDVRHRG